MTRTFRWVGQCYDCRRETEIETRYDHAAKALCDACAVKPHQLPSATGLEGKRKSRTSDPVAAALTGPSAPIAGDAASAARILADLFNLSSVGLRVVAARLYGKGSGASIEIDISNGETMTFATLREMMRPQALIAEVAACTGAAPALKQVQCAQALTLARQVATLVEVDSENDIAREWGRDFLDLADVLDVDMSDQTQRWQAFDHLAKKDPWGRHIDPHEPAPMPIVIRGHDGLRYVRTLWFERYVKNRDSSVSRTAIGPRMARVGWHRRGKNGDIKATAPGRTEVRIWPFWIVPTGWEGHLEAAA